MSSAGAMYGGVQLTPEERQLKSERKRIEGLIRTYQRDPKSYNPQMIASLERMALQYNVPFKRVVPAASFVDKAIAFGGGVLDAATFDMLIDDDLYSDESTRSAKNWGKGVGTIAPIALTGGAALAGKAGLTGAAKLLGAGKYMGMPGVLSNQAIKQGGKAVKAYRGQGVDDVLNAVNKSPGELQNVLKNVKLDKDGLKAVTKEINKKYKKNPGYAEKLNAIVKKEGASPTDLSAVQIRNLVDDMAGKDTPITKTYNKKVKAKTKQVKKTDPKTGQVSLFDEPVKASTKKITVDQIAKLGKKHNLTPAQIKALAKKLSDSKIKTLDEAADWLIESQKLVDEASQLGSLATKEFILPAATAGISGAAAISPFVGGYEKSRDQKMADDYDPYN